MANPDGSVTYKGTTYGAGYVAKYGTPSTPSPSYKKGIILKSNAPDAEATVYDVSKGEDVPEVVGTVSTKKAVILQNDAQAGAMVYDVSQGIDKSRAVAMLGSRIPQDTIVRNVDLITGNVNSFQAHGTSTAFTGDENTYYDTRGFGYSMAKDVAVVGSKEAGFGFKKLTFGSGRTTPFYAGTSSVYGTEIPVDSPVFKQVPTRFSVDRVVNSQETMPYSTAIKYDSKALGGSVSSLSSFDRVMNTPNPRYREPLWTSLQSKYSGFWNFLEGKALEGGGTPAWLKWTTVRFGRGYASMVVGVPYVVAGGATQYTINWFKKPKETLLATEGAVVAGGLAVWAFAKNPLPPISHAVTGTVQEAVTDTGGFLGKWFGTYGLLAGSENIWRMTGQKALDYFNPYAYKATDTGLLEAGRRGSPEPIYNVNIEGVGDVRLKNIPSQYTDKYGNIFLGGTEQPFVHASPQAPAFKFDILSGREGKYLTVIEQGGASGARARTGGIDLGLFGAPSETETGLTQAYTYYAGLDKYSLFDVLEGKAKFALFTKPSILIDTKVTIGDTRALKFYTLVEDSVRAKGGDEALWTFRQDIAKYMNVAGTAQAGVAGVFGTRAEREIIYATGTVIEQTPTTLRGKIGQYLPSFMRTGDVFIRYPSGQKLEVFFGEKVNFLEDKSAQWFQGSSTSALQTQPLQLTYNPTEMTVENPLRIVGGSISQSSLPTVSYGKEVVSILGTVQSSKSSTGRTSQNYPVIASSKNVVSKTPEIYFPSSSYKQNYSPSVNLVSSSKKAVSSSYAGSYGKSFSGVSATSSLVSPSVSYRKPSTPRYPPIETPRYSLSPDKSPSSKKPTYLNKKISFKSGKNKFYALPDLASVSRTEARNYRLFGGGEARTPKLDKKTYNLALRAFRGYSTGFIPTEEMRRAKRKRF